MNDCKPNRLRTEIIKKTMKNLKLSPYNKVKKEFVAPTLIFLENEGKEEDALLTNPLFKLVNDIFLAMFTSKM